VRNVKSRRSEAPSGNWKRDEGNIFRAGDQWQNISQPAKEL